MMKLIHLQKNSYGRAKRILEMYLWRCDDGKCQCCECENEHPQVTTSYEEINYDGYINNLKYWD